MYNTEGKKTNLKESFQENKLELCGFFYSSAAPSPGLCPHIFLYKILLSGCSGMVITASCRVTTKTFLEIEGSQHSQVDRAGRGAGRLGLVRDQRSLLSCRDGSGHQGVAMEGCDPYDFSSYSQLVQSLPHHSLLLSSQQLLTDQANLSFTHIHKIYNKYTPKITRV